MTLYHFTAEHLARRIVKEGITKGAISIWKNEQTFLGIAPGYIWLTDEPNWSQQTWCEQRIKALNVSTHAPTRGATN